MDSFKLDNFKLESFKVESYSDVAALFSKALHLGIENFPLVAAAVIGWVLSLLVYRRFLSPIAHVPGPALASVTRIWHMYAIYTGKQNLTFLDLHEKHGHFVRIAPNEVSVTHPEAIKKLILTPQYKGNWYGIARVPDKRFRFALSVLDPKEKVEMSKQLASAYTMSNVLRSEEQISTLISKLLGWVSNYADTKRPMDLDKFITFTAFDIVGQLVFSKEFGFLEQGIDIDDTIHLQLGFNCYVAIAGFIQWLHFLLVANPLVTYLDIIPTNLLVKTSNRALKERSANPEVGFDFLAHWLKTHKANPKKLSYKDVQAATMANIGAGSDTISCALQSFVYHMIRHPNAWTRVRAEIDAAQQEGLCQDAVISYADAQKLSFLQACIKEALRIFHPVTMGTQRVVPKEGIVIGVKPFPAGTTLSLNTFSMNLSTDVWGPDARVFNPDRWIEGDTLEMTKKFLPFSGGIGVCVGQNLAKIELSKILSTLVRDYDIRPVDPKQDWSYSAYFSTVPEQWPVYIEKRKSTAA
ncbi:cytochrome P450 [Bisporella sp. PMI_857]|nr:cytochrome P450 [Bisporella sp. PMI_857]